MTTSSQTSIRTEEGLSTSEIDFANALGSQDAVVVFGLLGRSENERRWRLFLSLALDEYIEFDRRDVRHSLRLTERESRIGGTLVWLPRSSKRVHVVSSSREAQADFLGGDFADRFRHVTVSTSAVPLPPSIGAYLAGGCHTGGDFDTLCAACTAVPTALLTSKPGHRKSIR